MRRYTVPRLLIVIRPVAAYRHGAGESSSDPRCRRGMGVALGSDLAEKLLRPAFAAADGRSPPHFQSPCASARGGVADVAGAGGIRRTSSGSRRSECGRSDRRRCLMGAAHRGLVAVYVPGHFRGSPWRLPRMLGGEAKAPSSFFGECVARQGGACVVCSRLRGRRGVEGAGIRPGAITAFVPGFPSMRGARFRGADQMGARST